MSGQPTDWDITYTLTEKIDCEDNLPTIPNIDLEIATGKAEQKSITGFTIHISNVITEEDAILIATKKANNFTDLLSTTSGTSSVPNLGGTRFRLPNGKFRVSKLTTISYNIRNNANLNLQNISWNDVLEGTNPELTQQMKYVNRAIGSISNRDYASAITNLFLACNQNPQGDLSKYKSLRNALNHNPVFQNDIDNLNQNFGQGYFEFTSEKRFDFTSEKNNINLRNESQAFLEHVRNDLKNRI